MTLQQSRDFGQANMANLPFIFTITTFRKNSLSQPEKIDIQTTFVSPLWVCIQQQGASSTLVDTQDPQWTRLIYPEVDRVLAMAERTKRIHPMSQIRFGIIVERPSKLYGALYSRRHMEECRELVRLRIQKYYMMNNQ